MANSGGNLRNEGCFSEKVDVAMGGGWVAAELWAKKPETGMASRGGECLSSEYLLGACWVLVGA